MQYICFFSVLYIYQFSVEKSWNILFVRPGGIFHIDTMYPGRQDLSETLRYFMKNILSFS